MKKIFPIFLLVSLVLPLCAEPVPFGASPTLSRGEYEAVKAASEQTDTAKALEILLDASRRFRRADSALVCVEKFAVGGLCGGS